MAFSTSDFEQWRQSADRRNSPNPPNQPQPASLPPPTLATDMSAMPVFARLRLQEHVKNPRAPFTSNLSVDEFLLTRSLGYAPIAQVIGASVYRIGSEWNNGRLYNFPCELLPMTEARSQAWRLAVGRLMQQASACEADIVAGVHLAQPRFATQGKRNSPGYGETFEVSLGGTAMRSLHNHSARTLNRPTLTTLTGSDLYALHAAGCRPAGIVYGCCVLYKPARWSVLSRLGRIVAPGTSWLNQEIPEYSHAVQTAQREAVDRMRGEALILNASGVVDVRFSLSVAETERDFEQLGASQKQRIAGVVVTVEAVGTAIREETGEHPPRQRADAILPISG